MLSGPKTFCSEVTNTPLPRVRARIGREMLLIFFNIGRSEQAFIACYSPVLSGRVFSVFAL